jgi:exodeoxyribonuclease V
MPRTMTLPDGRVLTLDPSQDAAVTAVLAALTQPGSEATLAGAAGTGKSTCVNAIEDAWQGHIIRLAPTGKAAKRGQEVTGKVWNTIHSAIFKAVEEKAGTGNRREELVFGEPAPPKGCGPRTLVIVDEASMVNRKLADELRKQVFKVGGRILWVGDHEQLPPVEGVWGARLDRPTARLDVVHRQALESPVLELATLIRTGRSAQFSRWGEEVRRIDATIESAVEWMEESRAVDALLGFASEGEAEALTPSRVLLTWTNKVRCRANSITRGKRGYEREEVQAGETLICTFNNHDLGVMNGEIIEVLKVEPCPEMTRCLGVFVQWVTMEEQGRQKRFLVVPETFDSFHPRKSERQVLRDAWKPLWASKKPRPLRDGTLPENVYDLLNRMDWSWEELRLWRDRCRAYQLQCTWGYCLTVHKSQGSEWQEVGFISCPAYRNNEDQDFKRRFVYTAVTRASERFTAFMLRVMPDYRRKNPYGED